MARIELKQNIWAVRFLYWHILNRALCLHPPWSMVEHIGYGSDATNTQSEGWFTNPPLKPCPPIPGRWPEPIENPECYLLYQNVCGKRPRGMLECYAHFVASIRLALDFCLNIGGILNEYSECI